MKKAIVTGGSRGIGRGIVLVLAAEGYDIAFSYHEMSKDAALLVEEVKNRFGRECFCFQASLHIPGEGIKLFYRCIDVLQGLSLLVNNAGGSRTEGLLDLTEENIDYQINLDYKNYLIMAREASRYMIKNRTKGSIVNISSSRGVRAYPGDAVYGSMKAAIERATESAALDLARYGIRINNVAPGATQIRGDGIAKPGNDNISDFWEALAPRIPLKRVGTPEDIGNAVAFLASEKASYITGITLRVDGGLILPGMPERLDSSNLEDSWGYKQQQFIIDNELD